MKSRFVKFISVLLSLLTLVTLFAVTASATSVKTLKGTINGIEPLTTSTSALSGEIRSQSHVSASSPALNSSIPSGSATHPEVTGEVIDLLETEIKKVSNYELSTSDLTISVKDDYIPTTPIASGDEDSADKFAKSVFYQVYALDQKDIDSILTNILEELPFDLFWFNKVQGFVYDCGAEYQFDFETNTLTLDVDYNFTLSVSNSYYDGHTVKQIEFFDSHGKTTYVDYKIGIDQSTKTAVNAARDNAKAIVEKYKDKTDLEKLAAYEAEICALTSYNDEANEILSGNHTIEEKRNTYGDPWQPIWVFDKNTSTEVVCEGYSKAFMYLCDISAFSDKTVKCYTISGDMGTTLSGVNIGHMWNIVHINGVNYHIDITNDDNDDAPYGLLFMVAPIAGKFETGAADEYYKFAYNRKGVTSIYYRYYYQKSVDDKDELIYYFTPDQLFLKLKSCSHVYDNNCDETCNNCGEKRTVTHDFSNTWSKDQTYHWHNCKTDGCTEVANVAEHTYTDCCDATCNICGYERTAPHNYTGFFDSGYHWTECALCHKTTEKEPHSYNGAHGNSCVVCNYTVFPDVKEGDWYCECVEFCAQKGYITGYANGKFGPADNIARQDFVVILARYCKADLSKYQGKGMLRDVATNAYYTAAVNWAVDNGIVTGYDDGRFGVGDPMTREQLVTMFYRFADKYLKADVSHDKSKAKGYSDYNKVSSFARDAICWAIDKGVMGGMDASHIGPQGNASRSQVAKILMNISVNNILPIK